MRAATSLVVAASLAACAHTLHIPAPSPGGPGQPLPPPAPSQLGAALQAPLAATLAGLERQVPTTFGTDGQCRTLGPVPVGVQYTVRRTPFRFTSVDGALRAETTLSMSAQACAGSVLGINLPFVGQVTQMASCGVSDSPRRITVTTETRVAIDPSWRLVATTQVLPPTFVDRCVLAVPMAQLDVSDLVAQFVSGEVSRATADMDRDIAARGDLRAQGEALWQSLRDPMELGDGFWMALRPAAVQVGAVSLDATSARTRVGIVATPTVVAGERPTVPADPLPPLSPVTVSGDGFEVSFDADIAFDEVTRMVQGAFRGHVLEVDGRHALVRDIAVRGDGRALRFDVAVTFQDGAFAGEQATLYMAGLPDYDAARRALVVRELDYSLDTRNALLDAAEWMIRSSLREGLAARAVFPLGDRLDRMQERARAALNRTVGHGTTLRGALTSVRPVGAFVTDRGVTVRVSVAGQVDVQQDLSGLALTAR